MGITAHPCAAGRTKACLSVNPYFIFNLLNKMGVVFSPLQLLPLQSGYWYHDTGGRMHLIIQMQTHFHSFRVKEELEES